jgi:hypothetical protein
MFGVARRLVVSLALVGPAVIGLSTGAAGAATAQARVGVAGTSVTPPTVNLVGSGSSVTFDPSSLTVTDKANGQCSSAHGEWVLTNTTSAKQTVLLFGQGTGHLKPGDSVDNCAGGGPGKVTLKLTLKSSPGGKLKVTVVVP